MEHSNISSSMVPPNVAGDVDIARFQTSAGDGDRWRISISGRLHFMADMETAWRIHAVANARTYNEAYAAYTGHAGVKGVGIEEFKRWTEANRPRIERLHDTPDGRA